MHDSTTSCQLWKPARQRAHHGKLVVITRNKTPGQTENVLPSGITAIIPHVAHFSSAKLWPRSCIPPIRIDFPPDFAPFPKVLGEVLRLRNELLPLPGEVGPFKIQYHRSELNSLPSKPRSSNSEAVSHRSGSILRRSESIFPQSKLISPTFGMNSSPGPDLPLLGEGRGEGGPPQISVFPIPPFAFLDQARMGCFIEAPRLLYPSAFASERLGDRK